MVLNNLHCSNSVIVPVQLVSKTVNGSLIEYGISLFEAKWITKSMSCNDLFSRLRSSILPLIISISLKLEKLCSIHILLVLNLKGSNIFSFSPISEKDCTRCDPMKPAPPVIRTRDIPLSLGEIDFKSYLRDILRQHKKAFSFWGMLWDSSWKLKTQVYARCQLDKVKLTLAIVVLFDKVTNGKIELIWWIWPNNNHQLKL